MMQLVLALALVSPMQAENAELRIYAVDMDGNPAIGLKVGVSKFEDVTIRTDENGIAVFNVRMRDGLLEQLNGVAADEKRPYVRVLVNLTSVPTRYQKEESYGGLLDKHALVGRAKWLTLDRDLDASAYIVPMWRIGQLDDLAEAVVTGHLQTIDNASPGTRVSSVSTNSDWQPVAVERCLVVLRHDATSRNGPTVLAKLTGDVDSWIQAYVPNVPSVEQPELARALFQQVEVGEIVPPRFDPQLAALFAEVDRLNRAARICMRAPDAAPPADGANPSPSPPPGDLNRPPGPGNPLPAPAPMPPAPMPNPIPMPALGKVVIHNRGRCEFGMLLNGQPLFVRRGGATSTTVALGSIATQIVNRTESARVWNHWRVAGGEHVLVLHAHSTVRRRFVKQDSRPTNARLPLGPIGVRTGSVEPVPGWTATAHVGNQPVSSQPNLTMVSQRKKPEFRFAQLSRAPIPSAPSVSTYTLAPPQSPHTNAPTPQAPYSAVPTAPQSPYAFAPAAQLPSYSPAAQVQSRPTGLNGSMRGGVYWVQRPPGDSEERQPRPRPDGYWVQECEVYLSVNPRPTPRILRWLLD